MKRTWWVIIIAGAALMLAAFAAFFAVYRGLPAGAAPAGLPPAHWLMKADDLSRAEAAGPMPSFQWVSCGSRQPFALPCPVRGNVPTFTDYYAFRRWVDAGGTGTVLIDYEGWTLTPHWQQVNMTRYMRMACHLGLAHGVTVIAAPVTGPATVPKDMTAIDVTAARTGCEVVDIQRQWMTREPAVYRGYVRQAVPQIRAASPHVVVIAGLRLSAPRPVTVAEAVATYKALRPLVDGFWMNAAIWTAANGGTGCATSGCPLKVVKFFQQIGA
jgi:hypothetical protein